MQNSELFVSVKRNSRLFCSGVETCSVFYFLLHSYSLVHSMIGTVVKRGLSTTVEYTIELLGNTVVSTGKLQNAKPRSAESRDHG